MMIIVPPLAPVLGLPYLADAHGGFGPSSAPGEFLWRGACIGCGAEVGCTAGYPQPECSGCGRARHGISDRPYPHRPGPSLPAVSPAPRPAAVEPLPGKSPNLSKTPRNGQPVILRPAARLSPADPALPGGVVRLLATCIEHGRRATLTAAVAADDLGVVASVAVRVAGVGYAVYRRREGDGWKFGNAVVADPYLRPAGATHFETVLRGEAWSPPPKVERAPAPKGTCPSCGAEVSLTKDGRIYASHKCKRAIGGA
jgi:hypothetical protein